MAYERVKPTYYGIYSGKYSSFLRCHSGEVTGGVFQFLVEGNQDPLDFGSLKPWLLCCSPFPPMSSGLWAEGQTVTVFEFKYVFLCLALTTLYQIPGRTRPAVKSNEMALMKA